MPKRVVTLGEVLLRLTTPGFERFIQSKTFGVTYGGCEANVAVALCNYGLEGVFTSKVPDNPIGQSALNHLRQFGVDTQFVARGGNRLGIYFLETGASVRPSKVVYDRAGSSIAEADISDFDFDKILEGADWFHTTGITPALSDKSAALTEAALKAAKEKGITTSLDLNFRQKLWSKEKASKVISGLCRYVDVMMDVGIGSQEEKETFFGIPKKELPYNDENGLVEVYKDVFEKMKAEFGFKYVASTLRESYSASDNGLRALIMDDNSFYQTKKYDLRIVDRVGGGDAFAAGLVYGLVNGMKASESAEFGVAASALKHTIPGDQNHATIDEIETLMKGDAAGRVVR